MASRKVPHNPHPRVNTRANRLIALAEEQAMEVVATLMHENDNDLRLMREIALRMKSRPLSVVQEDDADIRVLYAIKARMEHRIRRISEQRKVISQIGKVAA